MGIMDYNKYMQGQSVPKFALRIIFFSASSVIKIFNLQVLELVLILKLFHKVSFTSVYALKRHSMNQTPFLITSISWPRSGEDIQNLNLKSTILILDQSLILSNFHYISRKLSLMMPLVFENKKSSSLLYHCQKLIVPLARSSFELWNRS